MTLSEKGFQTAGLILSAWEDSVLKALEKKHPCPLASSRTTDNTRLLFVHLKGPTVAFDGNEKGKHEKGLVSPAKLSSASFAAGRRIAFIFSKTTEILG